jgi:hypothetical protein
MTISHSATPFALAFGAVLVLVASFASAQSAEIDYPVSELGNCGSKQECKTYCDDLAHVDECVSFAESRGLMDAEEARQARAFASLGGTGPGGCDSRESCEAYCEDVGRIRECLSFAEEHGFLPESEIEEARRVAQALEAGASLPGGCTSKKTCEAYCEDPANMRRCLAFAKQAGFMSSEELAEAEKMAAFLESGGRTPGGCRGERECKAYCENDDHMTECAEFAIQAGFMSEKEAEMFRKTGGKGPGGCKGRACEAYCENEANREQCVAFALEHGLMSEADRQMMEEGMQKAKEAIEKAPPEVLACIQSALPNVDLNGIREGRGFVSPRLGEVLPECFRKVMGNGANRGPFGPGSSATDCMRKVFGDDFEEKMRNGELDPGARDSEIRECMQAQMGEGFLNEEGQWERPERGTPPEGENFRPERDMRPEGEFRGPPPEGMPPTGEPGHFDERYREEYRQEFDARRMEMERQMRMEIETQMRSGNFDPSKLPADFRPEGAFPPPESFNRPPEGYDMSESRPNSGMPGAYPQTAPEGFALPPGSMPPPGGMPSEGGASTYVPPEGNPPPSGPMSNRDRFLAGVASVLLSLFGF